jgi:hypothetical protein
VKVYIVELADGRAGMRRVEEVISIPLHDSGEDGLEVRCPEGRLIIRPDVANQVTLEVRKHR